MRWPSKDINDVTWSFVEIGSWLSLWKRANVGKVTRVPWNIVVRVLSYSGPQTCRIELFKLNQYCYSGERYYQQPIDNKRTHWAPALTMLSDLLQTLLLKLEPRLYLVAYLLDGSRQFAGALGIRKESMPVPLMCTLLFFSHYDRRSLLYKEMLQFIWCASYLLSFPITYVNPISLEVLASKLSIRQAVQVLPSI